MEAPNKVHFRTSLLSLVMCLTIHRSFQFICITRKFEAVYFMESPLLEVVQVLEKWFHRPLAISSYCSCALEWWDVRTPGAFSIS